MTSTMRFDRWEDSTGALIAEGSAPRGVVTTTAGGTNNRGYYKASATTTVTTGTVDPTGFSMTFNAVAGRLYRASITGYMDASANSVRYDLRFTDASNNALWYMQDQTNSGWSRKSFTYNYIFTGSGSTTIKLRVLYVDGTLYFGGTPFNAQQAPTMLIEDIGPA